MSTKWSPIDRPTVLITFVGYLNLGVFFSVGIFFFFSGAGWQDWEWGEHTLEGMEAVWTWFHGFCPTTWDAALTLMVWWCQWAGGKPCSQPALAPPPRKVVAASTLHASTETRLVSPHFQLASKDTGHMQTVGTLSHKDTSSRVSLPDNYFT